MLGRKAAASRGIHITGTIGVIEQAADQGVLDLKEAFALSRRPISGFPMKPLDARLQLYVREKEDS